jgi:hypothetical protein
MVHLVSLERYVLEGVIGRAVSEFLQLTACPVVAQVHALLGHHHAIRLGKIQVVLSTGRARIEQILLLTLAIAVCCKEI